MDEEHSESSAKTSHWWIVKSVMEARVSINWKNCKWFPDYVELSAFYLERFCKEYKIPWNMGDNIGIFGKEYHVVFSLSHKNNFDNHRFFEYDVTEDVLVILPYLKNFKLRLIND